MRILVLWTIGAALVFGQTGLRGLVTDEAGAPLGGALVTATREYVTEGDVSRSRYSAITKADGTFEILGLGVGIYAVCGAKEPHEGYVDFCAWTLQPPKVTIRAGEIVTGYRIRLEKGVRLDVVMNDPDGALRGVDRDRKRQQLRLGAGQAGMPVNPLYFSQGDSERTEYFLYVPKRIAVKVVASAADADVGKSDDPPGLAKKEAGHDVPYVDGKDSQKVEFRYFRKKE